MSIALLIIDMQKEFMDIEVCKPSIESSLEYINETAKMFRRASQPVIIIQDEEVGDGPGSKGFELLDELLVESSDLKCTKVFSNAFWQTDLEELLKSLKVEFLVISGFAAEHCVLFTYNGGLERGFNASILQHGIAGFNPLIIKETQSTRAVISIEALDFILGKMN